MYNVTLKFILGLIAAIPTYGISFIYLKLNKNLNDKVLYYYFIAWFSLATYILSLSIGTLFMNFAIYQYSNFFLVMMLIFTEFAFSHMVIGKISNLRLPIISIISFVSISVLFLPGGTKITTYPNGEVSPAVAGYNSYTTIIMTLYILTSFTALGIKLNRNSSSKYKYYTTVYLIGIIISGVITLILFLFNVQNIIPSITFLTIALGAFVSTIALYKQPELLYLLPFHAVRLSVIDKLTGLDIYTYTWDKSQYVIDTLYTSVIQGLNTFSQDVIHMGTIKEIKLEDGIMSIWMNEDKSIYYVLLTNKMSYVLNIGMKRFIYLFYDTFKEDLEAEYVTFNRYKEADQIVSICFPFIPTYD